MKALITGASSGMGREFAKILSNMGYDLILVARRKNKLEELKKELNTKIEIIKMDLSLPDNCIKLYYKVKNEDIDILINNAGFGLLGKFNETNLDRELEMIDTNIKAVHILTKLFLNDFIKNDKGYILNVSSSASFMAGPLMSTYYATKNYVTRLTEAIYEELRRKKSNVYIGALCPGPVDTEFNDVANVTFSLKGLKANEVASYAIRKMFKRKLIIIPGFTIKFACTFNRFLPRKRLLKMTYNIQKKKDDNMNKNGFTLVELLAVIIILSVVALIAVPNVLRLLNDNKAEINGYEKKLIIDAAEAYMADNISEDCENTSVTVSTLIDDGYLADSYEKYKNNNVNITCEEKEGVNKYNYTLNE